MSFTSSVKTWTVCFGLYSMVGVVAIAGADSTAKIQCVGFPVSWRMGSDLQRANWERVREWSNSRGISIVQKAEWAVWFDAASISGTDTEQVVLSVGIGHTLPDDAIEVGKHAEIFYSFLSPERRATLPKEGKWVRELMSEEFLHQFVMPIDQQLALVRRSELSDRLRSMLDDLIKNRVKWQRN